MHLAHLGPGQLARPLDSQEKYDNKARQSKNKKFDIDFILADR
jgi:hypothetical protein